jgi:hypothetical protein
MASIAPSIDRRQIEISRVGVRLWKTSSHQILKFRLELLETHAEPPRGDLRWNVSGFDAEPHNYHRDEAKGASVAPVRARRERISSNDVARPN